MALRRAIDAKIGLTRRNLLNRSQSSLRSCNKDETRSSSGWRADIFETPSIEIELTVSTVSFLTNCYFLQWHVSNILQITSPVCVDCWVRHFNVRMKVIQIGMSQIDQSI
jgi:hypothetical protein